ncbi:MAG: indolepyruvate ferredoxin oxidoreductase family protein [Opitutaceae bacterium]|nr:indolepyruvate ferredoxin oxidoreductase family protein [Opitutaceae bacterium]
MQLKQVDLSDKYDAKEGKILLSGTQALVRLPLLQHDCDITAGHNTEGYISGYRGSPLGAYDSELTRAKKHLDANGIYFQPGVNEELAATAVWGTQQVTLFPGARIDGVFSIWYGKGPGVDRSDDVFKHANLAGTSKYGGVLVVVGDDHSAKSSTLAHQSEQALVSAMIPILNPSSVEDILTFGMYGWALSRYAGVWVGLKCVNETLETTVSLDIDTVNTTPALPDYISPSPDGIHIRMGYEPLAAEQRLMRYKMPLIHKFMQANQLDKVIFSGNKKKIGIITAGKAYQDVRETLRILGIDNARAKELGLGLYKLALTWPIEPEGLLSFATDYDEILVVEEKRALIEDQVARLLYDLRDHRPRLVGKRDDTSTTLLPADGILSPDIIASALVARLDRMNILDDKTRALYEDFISSQNEVNIAPQDISRTPYFCSGCPHNRSTKIPEGSQALAGIGCSYMAVWINRDTLSSVQMGGEGANWNGIAPFTDTAHIFQNMGDGTYFHSGILSIRAAVSCETNITYKILFNDAVAMTGGQPLDGQLTVPQLSWQVCKEGVGKIVVVTDDPEKYSNKDDFAPGVTIHHRRELDVVQRMLRKIPGTTILIYDQTCAAEKRRKRKRKEYPDPRKRLYINPSVCEGCGDCSEKSNCVSIQPLETELGRKRQIDQSACNKDYSCENGFCPSFVTVYGGQLAKADKTANMEGEKAKLKIPVQAPITASYNILITGIGGTGVITIGAILGMAAHLEEKNCSIFDMTGLAQKNGTVMSYLRIAESGSPLHAPRISRNETDLLLGCDLIVSGSKDVLRTLQAGRAKAVINSTLIPTGQFQENGDIDFQSGSFVKILTEKTGPDAIHFIEATTIATSLMGDSIASNLFLVGYACQAGFLPLSIGAILRAIEINGIAIENNKKAFMLGRLFHQNPDALDYKQEKQAFLTDYDDIVAHRSELLTKFQNEQYAIRYQKALDRIRSIEQEKTPDCEGLATAAAITLHKLMSYKDEYEVARLYSHPDFKRRIREQFNGDYTLRLNLAPPSLSRRDPSTGEPMKREFGPWIFPALSILAKFKFLRGTILDPFGHTKERRAEREIITDFETILSTVMNKLTPDNHQLALQIIKLPQKIRGFGPVKERNMALIKKQMAQLLAQYEGSTKP